MKVCVMTDSGDNSYSDEELAAEFDQLFPQGLAGPDVLQELAPAGWDNSPLLAVFHPSPEQIYEESRRLHANLECLWSLSGWLAAGTVSSASIPSTGADP
jgi:hypothetical protein